MFVTGCCSCQVVIAYLYHTIVHLYSAKPLFISTLPNHRKRLTAETATKLSSMLEELLELESPVRVEKEEKDLPEENFGEDNVSPHPGPHG